MFLLVRVAVALLLAYPCCLSAVPVFGLSFLLVLGSFGAPFVSSFQLVVLSLLSLAVLHNSRRLLCLPCFRILLLRSVACSALYFSLVAGSLVGWCPFYFSLRLPSSMRCFFVSFLSFSFLPSGCLFPRLLSLSSLSFWVSCFLLFPHFSVGLFFGSLVCPLVSSVSPLGFYFPCSFQVPRSSSSRFLSD